MEDKQFTTQFMAVLAFLVAFTIIILVIANSLYSNDSASDERHQAVVGERIKPVGEVYVGEVPADVAGAAGSAATAVVASASVELSGEEVYQQVCAACHTSGVLNSPKLGDAAAWETRMAKGVDTVYANAINGIGAMPAKGGRPDISDDAIKAAVDYLVGK